MYIILRSFEAGLRETFGFIARPLPCGPDLHRIVTYFFLGKTDEKGDQWPCLLSDFASFYSNYVGLPIFQNFRHDFFTQFSTNLTHVSGSFWGVEMRPMFTDFFVYSPPIFAAHPRIIAYIGEVTPPAPHPTLWKGTRIILPFYQFMECIIMRILQPNYGKVLERGALMKE